MHKSVTDSAQAVDTNQAHTSGRFHRSKLQINVGHCAHRSTRYELFAFSPAFDVNFSNDYECAYLCLESAVQLLVNRCVFTVEECDKNSREYG